MSSDDRLPPPPLLRIHLDAEVTETADMFGRKIPTTVYRDVWLEVPPAGPELPPLARASLRQFSIVLRSGVQPFGAFARRSALDTSCAALRHDLLDAA